MPESLSEVISSITEILLDALFCSTLVEAFSLKWIKEECKVKHKNSPECTKLVVKIYENHNFTLEVFSP